MSVSQAIVNSLIANQRTCSFFSRSFKYYISFLQQKASLRKESRYRILALYALQKLRVISLPCVKGGGKIFDFDGGIVFNLIDFLKEKQSAAQAKIQAVFAINSGGWLQSDNPSVSCADSSLYTREPNIPSLYCLCNGAEDAEPQLIIQRKRSFRKARGFALFTAVAVV